MKSTNISQIFCSSCLVYVMIWREIIVVIVLVMVPSSINFGYDKNNSILDFADLQPSIQTDFIRFENYKSSNYKFEDFFWTGSGDGPYEKDEEPWVIETSTTSSTIILTTTATVTTTIYAGTTDKYNNESASPKPKCLENCATHPTQKSDIKPTSKFENNTDIENMIDADREFWIVTVFKTDGKDPEITNLKNSLVKLYKKAFQRQQDRHLGIGYKRRKRKAVIEKPVNVYIHQVDQKDQNGKKEVEILYHVAVSGKPVSATTAVADMNLVSDEEVRQELGFPILIKAEPYIKPTQPQSLIKAKNTWIFIGISIISLIILLLLIAFLSLGCTKRKRSLAGIENRKQIFERSVDEVDKNQPTKSRFVKKSIEHSPTYINFRNQPSADSIRSGISSKSAAFFSPSTSSSTSLDISPLMKLKKTPPKKPPRPKAAINKTVPVNIVKIPKDIYDSDSDGRRNSGDTIYVGNLDPGVVSPKSYLSMPSVKSFPRMNNPEPLNKVLEPVSMLHLDMPEDTEITIERSRLSRHGSVGTNADPGVIGPVVWDIHCQRLKHGVSVDEGIEDLAKTTKNVTRMRKRFHELLDDTFSLFGSRAGSPVNDKNTSNEMKSKSATGLPKPRIDGEKYVKPRPRTSILRKNSMENKPKGAWTSSTSSPLQRPLSAGIVAPKVNVEHIQAEGKFRESDPAIPLIAAIKTEIQKCSLPGSTTELNKETDEAL